MLVIDTNVFVYAADKSASEHARCRELLERRRSGALPWFTTWGVVYEFLRVSTHPRVFRSPWSPENAWRFAEALLASPSLTILVPTPRHAEIAAATVVEVPELRGNLWHDAETAILMREHGLRRICTRDTDFHRFAFLEVIDPLAEP